MLRSPSVVKELRMVLAHNLLGEDAEERIGGQPQQHPIERGIRWQIHQWPNEWHKRSHRSSKGARYSSLRIHEMRGSRPRLLQVKEGRVDIRADFANVSAIGAYKPTKACSTCDRHLATSVAERRSLARTRARDTMCSEYPKADIR